jgi:hypothetical protein
MCSKLELLESLQRNLIEKFWRLSVLLGDSPLLGSNTFGKSYENQRIFPGTGCSSVANQVTRRKWKGGGGVVVTRAGIFKKSMGARHRVGIGLLYRPARLHRLAEFIPWNRFRGPIHVQKYQLRAHICKPFKEPRNRFPAWRAGTTTLFVVPAHQAT